jgi:polysaccharide deacetylase family protein (PEP-CTERM system associated)
VRPVLELLDKYETRATFFVLGIVAEKHPGIVAEIHSRGHEIASHAYSHKTLYELGEVGFEEEIGKSSRLLESITGERPIGFRAPSFSIDNSTKWAFKVLTKYGFKYDSSIFPVKTMLYGIPNAPSEPYKPSMDDVARHDPEGDIIEFPLAVLKLGRNIPVAGGFYMRVLPLWFVKFAIRRVNRARPAVIYLHPWELYPLTPRLKGVPLFPRFVTYHGINSGLKKTEGLLDNFEFKPLRDFLEWI